MAATVGIPISMGSLPKVVAGESYPVRESRGDQVAEPVMIRRARQRARQARATQAVPVAERLALATQVAVAVAPVQPVVMELHLQHHHRKAGMVGQVF